MGEGLGNQFLANIRECDAIAHVVRCFEDDDITHVEGKIAPVNDIETIETELMLADLDSLEKRVPALEKKAKTGGDKEAKELLDLMTRCLVLLREGKPARVAEVKADERKAFLGLGLLSSKPVLYVCNVEEASADAGNSFSAAVAARAEEEGAVAVVVSARIESEIAVMPAEEQAEYLEAVGLVEPGPQPRDPRRLRALAPHHLLHRRAEGDPRLDGRAGHQGAGSRGRDPHRFREGLHPRRDGGLRRLRRGRARARPARGRPASSGSRARSTVVADGDVLHFRFAN